MGDFSRSFFRGDAREVRKEEEQKKKEEEEKDPLLRRARVILPQGIAPTKEHDLAGEVSGSSLKPGELSPLREPSIVVHYSIAA